MVVTLRPATVLTGVTQERRASPSTCTVQAPHSDIPQPNLVPVRPTVSRITQRSGVLGSTSTDWGLPLRVKAVWATKASLIREGPSLPQTQAAGERSSS